MKKKLAFITTSNLLYFVTKSLYININVFPKFPHVEWLLIYLLPQRTGYVTKKKYKIDSAKTQKKILSFLILV